MTYDIKFSHVMAAQGAIPQFHTLPPVIFYQPITHSAQSTTHYELEVFSEDVPTLFYDVSSLRILRLHHHILSIGGHVSSPHIPGLYRIQGIGNSGRS